VYDVPLPLGGWYTNKTLASNIEVEMKKNRKERMSLVYLLL